MFTSPASLVLWIVWTVALEESKLPALMLIPKPQVNSNPLPTPEVIDTALALITVNFPLSKFAPRATETFPEDPAVIIKLEAAPPAFVWGTGVKK